MTEIKLFDRWPMNVVVNDVGLRPYINLKPAVIPKSGGRLASKQFHKSKMNIIERLITRQMVPGHRSKKHVLTSGMVVGKWQTNYNIIKNAFEKIEQATKKNPVEVFVKAIENAATREEIAAYQVGGIIVRRAVITSPQRRVDLALRNITQAAYRKSFGKKLDIADALVDEIVAAYNYDMQKSEAIKERDMTEKQAEGAR
jgi:small subunit ribosomal protein S7